MGFSMGCLRYIILCFTILYAVKGGCYVIIPFNTYYSGVQVFVDLKLMDIDHNDTRAFTEADKQNCSGRGPSDVTRECIFALGIKKKSQSGGYLSDGVAALAPHRAIKLQNINTYQDLEDALAKRGLPWVSQKVWVNQSYEKVDFSDYCTTMLINVRGNANGFKSLDDRCSMTLPPADVTCKLSPDNIKIQHGDLALKEVENHIAESQVNLSCTADASVSVNIIGASFYDGHLDVSGDGLIYSDIYVNEKKLDGVTEQAIDVKSNLSNPLTMKSILHKKDGAKAGGYSSSAVLVVSPQ